MLYKHDCKNCVYVKTVGNCDYHICIDETAKNGSLIRRYSSEGSDYRSTNIDAFLRRL